MTSHACREGKTKSFLQAIEENIEKAFFSFTAIADIIVVKSPHVRIGAEALYTI